MTATSHASHVTLAVILLLLPAWERAERPAPELDEPTLPGELPAIPILPAGMVMPPSVVPPWATVLLLERPAPDLFQPAPQPNGHQRCDVPREVNVFPDPPSRRAGRAEYTFPALYSTPPKLWGTGRCVTAIGR